jgi:hypothetical protein
MGGVQIKILVSLPRIVVPITFAIRDGDRVTHTGQALGERE